MSEIDLSIENIEYVLSNVINHSLEQYLIVELIDNLYEMYEILSSTNDLFKSIIETYSFGSDCMKRTTDTKYPKFNIFDIDSYKEAFVIVYTRIKIFVVESKKALL